MTYFKIMNIDGKTVYYTFEKEIECKDGKDECCTICGMYKYEDCEKECYRFNEKA